MAAAGRGLQPRTPRPDRDGHGLRPQTERVRIDGVSSLLPGLESTPEPMPLRTTAPMQVLMAVLLLFFGRRDFVQAGLQLHLGWETTSACDGSTKSEVRPQLLPSVCLWVVGLLGRSLSTRISRSLVAAHATGGYLQSRTLQIWPFC